MNDGAILLEEYRSRLVGLPVSHVWRGYGSAFCMEFGQLTPKFRKDGRPLSSEGEFSLMIEWSWRIETGNAIVCGSWSDEELWPSSMLGLVGRSILDIGVSGRLPEILLTLSDDAFVMSFMTSDGDPAWSLIDHRTNGLPSLLSRSGRLIGEQ